MHTHPLPEASMNRWLQTALIAALLALGWQNRGSHLSAACSSTIGQMVPGQQAAGGFGQSWQGTAATTGSEQPMAGSGENPMQAFCSSLMQQP